MDPGDVLRFDDRTLISRYRLPRHLIILLTEQLRPTLERPTRRHGALPVICQVTNALRFFAKGDFQTEVADLSKISQPAMLRNLEEVATAIGRLAPRYIRFPGGQEVNTIKEAFYRQSNMPGVLGLIDGSLFPIKAPVVDEGAYVCRKGFHAINVQAVGDHRVIIRHLVASDLNTYLEEGNVSGWLLGDSGYPLKGYLLTPVSDEQTAADMRWRCHDLSGGYLQYSPEKVVLFIKATAVLHNICRLANLPDPEVDLEQEHPEEAGEAHANGLTARAQLIREFFTRP
ncbi:putative nuclease HARBI1 [Odontesthes bonariensis]